MRNLPIFLRADEVRELGVDPENLEAAGMYYQSKDGTKKLVGEPLYRSSETKENR